MNEKIEKFAIEAGFEYDEFKDIWYLEGLNPSCDSEFQRFAELIVRECLEQVRDEVQYEYDWKLADAVSKRVLEHFGVKEPQGWVCPKCGVDRIKASCPQGHTAALTGDCPMYGIAL